MEDFISAFVVLLLVPMSCFTVSCQPTQPPPPPPPQTTTFVSYLFVLQWPPSVCGSSLRCKGSIPAEFTIHGLWPQDAKNRGVPPYASSRQCSTLVVVDLLNALQKGKLEAQLTQVWPDLKNTGDINLHRIFWEHEWKAHGKCSDYGDNPIAYFSAAISLRNKVVSVLNLPRGGPHTAKYIASQVEAQVGAIPEIHCVTRRAQKQELLGEIRLCYKKGNPTPQGIQHCARLYSGTCKTGQESIYIL